MGLKLDGIATNGNLDSSGEVLNVKGHDISDLEEGRGVINFEHEKGPEDIIGAIIYAKKIMDLKDCENDRQKMYFELSGGPYVYIIGELYEDEEHPGAVACAAMVRYYKKRKVKMFIGFSIEGQTLERDGNKLERSVGRKVAFTLRPCNKSAIMDVLDDSKLANTVRKCEEWVPKHKEYEIDNPIFDDALLDLKEAVADLNKTLTAGGGNVAPSALTGGAALVPEELLSHTQKNRLKAAVRDWNRMRPLKEVVKAALPEIGDNYIDHFVNLAEDLSLKKGMPPLGRIGAHHSTNAAANEDQKKLIEGLYWDKSRDFEPDHFNYTGGRSMRTLLNDSGDTVLVKQPHRMPYTRSPHEIEMTPFSEDTAVNSTAYSHAAKDFFGLGEHVPTTNHFHNPHTPTETRKWQAMKFLPDAKTIMENDPSVNGKAFKRAREDGTLHKLALMDLILGNTDERHQGNILIDPKGKIYHVDNDHAFNHTAPRPATYYQPDESLFGRGWQGIGRDTIHADALKWLKGLNVNRLHDILAANGIKEKPLNNALAALVQARWLAERGTTFDDMHRTIVENAFNRYKGDVENASIHR